MLFDAGAASATATMESPSRATYNQCFISYLVCQPVKAILPVTVEARQFVSADFIGGDPALDFVNTVLGRDQAPRDWLDSYLSMLKWAGLAHLLPEKLLRSLAKKAQEEPADAAAALKRAKLLREALFALITALVSDTKPPKDALALLREHWLAGVRAHELCVVDGRVVEKPREGAADFDLIASMVAYRMVNRVLRCPIDRLRICRGTNCAWLFIDSSKAGRRCWCDMAVCGNTAKSKRFQARARLRRKRPIAS